MARSWVRNICGSARQKRIARSPIAGLGMVCCSPRAVQRLVGAEVERAQHHRPALHRLGHVAVGLELLVLARQLVAVEEHELGAEQADALGARLEHFRHVLRQLDVGEQLDRRAVDASPPAWT